MSDGAARLPRVTIEFCTQCKWLLRAAYYAQELLSTFPTLGEVALQPSTGGTFIISITPALQAEEEQQEPKETGHPEKKDHEPKQQQDSRETEHSEQKHQDPKETEHSEKQQEAEEKEHSEQKQPEQENARGQQEHQTITLWDRRRDGGFPETKILKRRVRDVVEPQRALGHVDNTPTTREVSLEHASTARNSSLDSAPTTSDASRGPVDTCTDCA